MITSAIFQKLMKNQMPLDAKMTAEGAPIFIAPSAMCIYVSIPSGIATWILICEIQRWIICKFDVKMKRDERLLKINEEYFLFFLSFSETQLFCKVDIKNLLESKHTKSK